MGLYMSYVLTFVAPQHHKEIENIARKTVKSCGLAIENIRILAAEKALDIFITADFAKDVETKQSAIIAKLRAHMTLPMDIFCQLHAPENRRKKLLLSDMDATIVAEETLDELAAAISLKEEIAAITAATMRGELNFEDSVRKRVGMLKGLPIKALDDTAATLNYSRGASSLVKTMTAHGAQTALVSGGFTYFTNIVAQHIGFKDHFGNTLDIQNDELSGEIIPPIRGKEFKAELLQSLAMQHNIPLSSCLCLGDGANDAAMLALCQKNGGLAFGYRPKDVLKQQLTNNIIYGSLTSALYAQGYTEDEIIP